jgi:hypothetical protein
VIARAAIPKISMTSGRDWVIKPNMRLIWLADQTR